MSRRSYTQRHKGRPLALPDVEAMGNDHYRILGRSHLRLTDARKPTDPSVSSSRASRLSTTLCASFTSSQQGTTLIFTPSDSPPPPHMRRHTHTHARTHARTRTHTHARTHACTHARTHARTYARTHVRARAHTRCLSHWLLLSLPHLTRCPSGSFSLSAPTVSIAHNRIVLSVCLASHTCSLSLAYSR